MDTLLEFCEDSVSSQIEGKMDRSTKREVVMKDRDKMIIRFSCSSNEFSIRNRLKFIKFPSKHHHEHQRSSSPCAFVSLSEVQSLSAGISSNVSFVDGEIFALLFECSFEDSVVFESFLDCSYANRLSRPRFLLAEPLKTEQIP